MVCRSKWIPTRDAMVAFQTSGGGSLRCEDTMGCQAASRWWWNFHQVACVTGWSSGRGLQPSFMQRQRCYSTTPADFMVTPALCCLHVMLWWLIVAIRWPGKMCAIPCGTLLTRPWCQVEASLGASTGKRQEISSEASDVRLQPLPLASRWLGLWTLPGGSREVVLGAVRLLRDDVPEPMGEDLDLRLVAWRIRLASAGGAVNQRAPVR